jgi:MFS family permease
MTVFFVVSGTGQALAGFVVDRVGAYRVLVAGIALCTLSAAVLASAHGYGALMLGAAIAGLGNAVFHPADFTLLNRQVSAQRLAHAFSFHGIAGTLGWAAAPMFLAGIAAVVDWRTALWSAALLGLAVLGATLAHRRLLDCAPVEHPRDAAHGSREHALMFLRLPAVWMCFGFFFITAVALGGIQSFGPAALQDLYEAPIALATGSITAYMLASAAGMIAGGFLAARLAQHDRIIAVAFVAAAAMSAVLASGALPAAAMLVPMAVMGFAAGIAGPSRDLLVRAAAPRNATGRVYGVVYSGLDIGLSFAPLMFGAMMDARHPGWVFTAVGAFQLLALLTALGVGVRAVRRQPRAA